MEFGRNGTKSNYRGCDRIFRMLFKGYFCTPDAQNKGALRKEKTDTMKKRMGILLLASSLLIALLVTVGCANVALPPDVSKESTSKRLEEIAESLPQTDEFRGETLTILTPDATTIVGDEEAAGSVRGALKNRNELIAASYGMEVAVRPVQEDEILETLREAQTSGTSAGDLLCYSAETTAALWAEGLLQDLNTLAFFSPADACFDVDAAAKLQAGSRLYLLPDPSAQSYDHTYVLFYDRELVRNAGLPLPEKEVNAGNWTIETFRRYAEAVARSVMDKSSYDLSTDVFGYSSRDNAGLLPYLLWCGMDDPLFARKDGGIVDFVYDDADTLSDLIEPLRGLYNSACRYPQNGGDAYTAFSEGRIGFLFGELEELKNFYANAEREYGILPFPKRDAKQTEYRCPIAVTGNVLSVPAQAAESSRSGLGLTAICAAGGALLQEAEVQTYVTLYSLDNDQTCMLETIMGNAAFDFGWVYGTQERSVRNLSGRMLTDVLVDDVRFTTILRNELDAFRAYAKDHFS